jgi:purine-binding chemotaxis protein CheW
METVRTKYVETKEKRKTGSFQIIVFKQGEEEYGLHIDQIKEVVVTPRITRMPQTPGYIKGVVNIQGDIIVIMDMEEKFNLKRVNGETHTNRYILVAEKDDMKVGVLVREVPDTLTISGSQFDDSISIINDQTTEENYIKGIVRTESRMIVLIDLFKVIDQETMSTLRKTVGG